MTDVPGGRTDNTRQQILRAASREFAARPYSLVSLDDIIAQAGLTKGGLYFYFQTKHALAVAIVEEQLRLLQEAVAGRLDRQLSGLETLIEVGYHIGARDIQFHDVRAALNLLEQVGRSGGLRAKVVSEWSAVVHKMVLRGIADGDIKADTDPDAVGRLLISIYMGVRQTADLQTPADFLDALEQAWILLLPGLADPERLGYFGQFVKRCTAVVKRNFAPPGVRGPVRE